MRIISGLAKAQMLRFWRDPVALFFTLVFPLIFLLIFGTIFGGEGSFSARVAMFNESDHDFAASFVSGADEDGPFEIVETVDKQDALTKLTRSQIEAIITLPKNFGAVVDGKPAGKATFEYLKSNENSVQPVLALFDKIVGAIDEGVSEQAPLFSVEAVALSKDSQKPIDYVFSGILAFSIVGVAVFGMAMGFSTDKKTGSLYRLKLAPIKAYHVVLATVSVFIALTLLAIAVLVIVGMLLFDVTVQGDVFSFMSFAAISVVSTCGFGLLIGGWAKDDKQAAPLSQLVAMPMFFLSGVFFPTFMFPDVLQTISRFVPLTHINDGLRLIVSEGYSIDQLGSQVLILVATALVLYPIAFKIFRWQ